MTGQRVELPGGWAELADPTKVTERRRRPVVRLFIAAMGDSASIKALTAGSDEEKAAAVADLRPETLESWDDLNDALVAALVTAWSWEDVPITAATVADIPGDAYTRLRELVAPMVRAMLPDFSPDGVKDPASPTGPSNA